MVISSFTLLGSASGTHAHKKTDGTNSASLMTGHRGSLVKETRKSFPDKARMVAFSRRDILEEEKESGNQYKLGGHAGDINLDAKWNMLLNGFSDFNKI